MKELKLTIKHFTLKWLKKKKERKKQPKGSRRKKIIKTEKEKKIEKIEIMKQHKINLKVVSWKKINKIKF